MESIRVKDILADEDQPRKFFDASKMKALAESIKRDGIMQPLIVEEMGKGKYLLIDGERRFRAAIQVGLAVVPAIVEPHRDETERKIRQFALQEQHESWTPVEKAIALLGLAAALDTTLIDVCNQVGMGSNERDRYVAFASITNKEAYLRSEIPIAFAKPIRSVVNHARKVTIEVLEEPFTHSEERAMEKKLIEQIKTGIINNNTDFVLLKDSFTKSPKVVRKFIENAKATPESLFTETKARGAYLLRNATIEAKYITTHLRRFMEVKDVKPSEDTIARFKEARAELDTVIGLVE